MLESLHRRQFMQHIAGTAMTAELSGSLVLAGEVKAEDLMAHVDPLLRPLPATLTEEQNALPLLDEACKLLTKLPYEELDEDLDIENYFLSAEPNADRDRSVSLWLDKNERALGLVKQAVRQGKVEFPNIPWDKECMERAVRLRPLAEFLQLYAQRLVAQGKPDEAVRVSHTMWAAFDLVRNGGAAFLEHMLAIACTEMAWALMRRIAQSRKSDAKFLRGMLAQLPVLPVSLDGLRSAIRAEYSQLMFPTLVKTVDADYVEVLQVFIDWSEDLRSVMSRDQYNLLLKQLTQLFEGHPRPYDLLDTVQRTSKHYVGLIRDFDLPWSEHKLQSETVSEELAAWPAQLSMSVLFAQDAGEVSESQLAAAREKLKAVKNPIGKKLLADSGLESKAMHRTALSDQARYEATRLFLAVLVFASEAGELPADLNALVKAGILKTVPLDPFSDRQFQYSREQKVIWSVGFTGHVSPAVPVKEEDETDVMIHVWRLEGTQRQ